jgi:hypothetical protein
MARLADPVWTFEEYRAVWSNEAKETYVKPATLPEGIMWKMNYMFERKPRTVQS